jgi:acyl-CoA thioester hydrolase
MNHVNNGVYLSYLEMARGNFFQEVLGVDFDDINGVLANLKIDFRLPIDLDDDVVVSLSIESVGDSSFTTAFEILADGEVAATARSVQVYVDDETGNSRPLPDDWEETLSEWEAA